MAAAPSLGRPGLRALLRRWRLDRSGIGAVEFALLLPLMLLLYFGAYEVGEAVTINRKVTHIASTLGDLIAQSKTITGAEVQNILDAGEAIISPYPDTTLTLSIAQIAVDARGDAKVEWAVARNTTPLVANAPIVLPTAMSQPSSWLIRVEVHYRHAPTVGYVLTGSFDFSDQFMLRPRLSDKVTYRP